MRETADDHAVTTFALGPQEMLVSFANEMLVVLAGSRRGRHSGRHSQISSWTQAGGADGANHAPCQPLSI